MVDTVENFVEVADGKVIFDMIYDVMTVNLLPQQETELSGKVFWRCLARCRMVFLLQHWFSISRMCPVP